MVTRYRSFEEAARATASWPPSPSPSLTLVGSLSNGAAASTESVLSAFAFASVHSPTNNSAADGSASVIVAFPSASTSTVAATAAASATRKTTGADATSGSDVQKQLDRLPVPPVMSANAEGLPVPEPQRPTGNSARRLSALPIVGMSANSDAAAQALATQAGMTSFLPKPFAIADLHAVLAAYQ
jgi:CheY-like chemotaxis protein